MNDTSQAAVIELEMIEAEIRRRKYSRDPKGWVINRLNEFLWSKQVEIAESVRDYRRTAVRSCHEAGKSYIASRIAAWWLDTHPPGEAFIVTSAPTAPQVRAILWREIGRAQAKGLPGRTNQTEWWMQMPSGKDEIVGFGRKPNDMDPAAFQGIHAKYVLVIFDEAGGIPGGSIDNPLSLWESADSLIANDYSRFLVIGNPDYPESEFNEVCKPGSGWNVIGISAFETPNLTGEEIPDAIRPMLVGKTWIEEKRHKWGETSPLYISKVLGKFPDVAKDGLIPMSWIMAARLRNLEPKTEEERAISETWARELGVDVGGGGDKNVVAHRHGPIVRVIRSDRVANTMESCGNLIVDIRNTNATCAKVDMIGIGRGLTERAQEQGYPVVGINVGREPKNKEAYANLRAEGYWALRERFQSCDIDLDSGPDGDDLVAQLVDMKFKRSSAGKILIESKDEIRRRGKSSPDEADAVMLCCLPPHLYVETIAKGGVLW